jgi:Protein of unknown function (DUF2442)
MFTQSNPEEDSPAAMIPAILPRMPWRVSEVTALEGFRLQVRFLDGLEGTVDMAAFVHSPSAGVFARLADPSLFAQVSVELGVVTWPGEIDLAPDAMYHEIRESGEWLVH